MAKAKGVYRVRFIEDPDAQFEECNGESRPLTEEEYAEATCRACPDHPRAGTKHFIDSNGQAQTGCRVCARTDYADISYEEYLAFYGNPDRHVYLMSEVQRQCPCCKVWSTFGGTGFIDCMDTDPAIGQMDRWYSEAELEKLEPHLREVAQEDISDAKHTAGDLPETIDPLAQHATSPELEESRRQLEALGDVIDPRD